MKREYKKGAGLHMLKIMMLLMMMQIVYAEKIHITSLSMEAEENKKEVHFIGDAKVVRGIDWLHADRVVVYFDANDQIIRYVAIGKVTFDITKEDKHFNGKADKVVYVIHESHYLLEGHAEVDEVLKNHHVDGDKITLDVVTGKVHVQGSISKPVKLILETKDENGK